MPHIVTALFESQAQAQRALQAMMQAGVTRDRVTLIGGTPGSDISSISGFHALSARDDTLVELNELPLPQEDLRLFEQGLQRGCALLSARIERSNVEEAIQVIEMFDPIDLDRDSAAWGGGQGGGQGGAGRGVDLGAPLGSGLAGGTSSATTPVEAAPGMGAMADDTSILGASDRRTDEAGRGDQGRSTMPTGQRRAEERAGAPGVLELGARGAQGTGQASPGVDRFRRDTNRSGRVRTYSRD